MRNFIPEVVVDLPCHTGECPVWHPAERLLYWTDIPNGRLYRFDPANGKYEECYQGRPVGGFTLQADGSLLLFRDKGNVVVWRNGQIIREIVSEIPDLANTRFNDVCADPSGRVFCGTMSAPDLTARLYRLDTDGSIHLLQEGYGTANGMGFTPDQKIIYFNDSVTASPTTFKFDYNVSNGAISNRRVFRAALEHGDPGKGDGLAVDANGDVWTGRWDGSALIRFKPDGTKAETINFPVKKVSSLCFGGETLNDIYATTAGGHNRGNGESNFAGALFRIKNYPVAGLPRFMSRVGMK